MKLCKRVSALQSLSTRGARRHADTQHTRTRSTHAARAGNIAMENNSQVTNDVADVFSSKYDGYYK